MRGAVGVVLELMPLASGLSSGSGVSSLLRPALLVFLTPGRAVSVSVLSDDSDFCLTLTTRSDRPMELGPSPSAPSAEETVPLGVFFIGDGDPELRLALLLDAGNMPNLASLSLASSESDDSASLSALRLSLCAWNRLAE